MAVPIVSLIFKGAMFNIVTVSKSNQRQNKILSFLEVNHHSWIGKVQTDMVWEFTEELWGRSSNPEEAEK